MIARRRETRCFRPVPKNDLGILGCISDEPLSDEAHLAIINGPLAAISEYLENELCDEDIIVEGTEQPSEED